MYLCFLHLHSSQVEKGNVDSIFSSLPIRGASCSQGHCRCALLLGFVCGELAMSPFVIPGPRPTTAICIEGAHNRAGL